MTKSTRSGDFIQTYRLRVQESEAKIEAVQSELKELQQMVVGGHVYKRRDNQL